MAQTMIGSASRSSASRTTVGRRSLPASDRPPSGAGTWGAASSVSSRSLAAFATSARRSAVGSAPARRGDSPRPDSDTADRSSAIAAPCSPKVWGTAMRMSWPPSDGAPTLRPPARSTDRSASWPRRRAWRSVRPSTQTCTASPSASPGASRTIAAAIGKDENRSRNQRMPALPTVLPSVETNRCGRWCRDVADARARLSITAVAAGARRDPGRRVARRDHEDPGPTAADGRAGHGEVEVVQAHLLAALVGDQVLDLHAPGGPRDLGELALDPARGRLVRPRSGRPLRGDRRELAVDLERRVPVDGGGQRRLGPRIRGLEGQERDHEGDARDQPAGAIEAGVQHGRRSAVGRGGGG